MTPNIIFIDANTYLDLYRTHTGAKLLAPLNEQAEHIVVTQQTANEVNRNKVKVATDFFIGQLKDVKATTTGIPDHLYGVSTEQSAAIREKMKDISAKASAVNADLDSLAADILSKIGRSEDDVSRALAPIFGRAIRPDDDDLRLARIRKELGNPPGKSDDPIGDELTWEQLKKSCKDKGGLWIITRDGDYCSKFRTTLVMNAFLRSELKATFPTLTVSVFDNIIDGLKDFASKAGVKADQLPAPEEEKKIKEEQEALPPLGWLPGFADTLERLARVSQENPFQEQARRQAQAAEKLLRLLGVPQPRRIERAPHSQTSTPVLPPDAPTDK